MFEQAELQGTQLGPNGPPNAKERLKPRAVVMAVTCGAHVRRPTAIWRLKRQYLSFALLIAARETAGRELRGRAALGLPARRARRATLSARPRARSCCARPPPARGRSEGAARARSDGRDGRRAREEETTAARANGPARLRRREPPTATHARRARRALVPRCPPRARSARSGGRREGARRGRGRRPATRRAKSKRRRPPRRARTALLDCGGENHPRRPRPVSTPPFYSRSCATPSEDKNLTLGVLGIAVSRSHPPPCTRFRPAQTLAHNRSTNLDCRGRTRALLPLLSAAAGQPLKPRHQGTPDGRPVEKGWAWLVWSGARPAFWTDREGAKRGEAKGDDPGGP